MSLLAPLYFLGALAVGLPILFHLIRRRPRNRNTFSSLMFLSPTPPRLTRRSRLENWPLLLLRALALLMIAAAFARPYLRSSAQTEGDEPEQLVLLVVDASASMRREGLWRQVGDEIDSVLETMSDRDRVGLVVFDRRPRTLVALDSAPDAVAVDHRIVRDAFDGVQPSWFAGDVGAALTFAADALNEVVANEQGGTAEKQLILLSDMQSGAATDALQGYDWPKDVGLEVRTVQVAKPTNVSALVLQGEEPVKGETPVANEPTRMDAQPHRRLRVANAADSQAAEFSLQWQNSEGVAVGPQRVVTNVPPGEVRIVRMESPPEEATSLQLSGDDHAFDNTIYVATAKPTTRKLLYVGDRPEDPRESLPYYLQRASLDNRRQKIEFTAVLPESWPDELDPADTALLVVAPPFSAASSQRVRHFVEQGGVALVVLSEPATSAANGESFLREVSGDSELAISEAEVSDYAMLSAIDFQSPLFSIFADPRFSDFTKIRFWQHRRIEQGDEANWQVVAEFDDRAPAILHRPIGDGRLWVLVAGWQPSQSQLALSTKFVPMLSRWIDPAAGEGDEERSRLVGDELEDLRTDEARLVRPDGTVQEGSDEEVQWLADVPGVYQIVEDQETRRVAVNVAPAESETTVMEPAELERFGIVLGKPLDRQLMEQQQRQLRNVELERQQSWWRWLILSAVGLLAVETWWAGRLVGAAPRERHGDGGQASNMEVNQ